MSAIQSLNYILSIASNSIRPMMTSQLDPTQDYYYYYYYS